jgi:hypothetical protein
MKCDMNCGRDAYFYDEVSGIAVCEECWKTIDAVAIHCASNFLKTKSPFKFKPVN